MKIWVRIGPQHPRSLHGRPLGRDRKTEAPCHSGCDTIKIHPWSEAGQSTSFCNIHWQKWSLLLNGIFSSFERKVKNIESINQSINQSITKRLRKDWKCFYTRCGRLIKWKEPGAAPGNSYPFSCCTVLHFNWRVFP